jgi:hypothetical protein
MRKDELAWKILFFSSFCFGKNITRQRRLREYLLKVAIAANGRELLLLLLPVTEHGQTLVALLSLIDQRPRRSLGKGRHVFERHTKFHWFLQACRDSHQRTLSLEGLGREMVQQSDRTRAGTMGNLS